MISGMSADVAKDARIDEASLKALVLTRLRSQRAINARSILSSEFRLGHSAVRADLAILGSTFIGVEIKSAFDSLRRFRSQADAYARHFERFIVVAAARHVRAFDFSALPEAELWIVREDGSLELPGERPATTQIATYSALMTQQELKRYLPGQGRADGKPPTERDAFAAAFAARYGQTSERFWTEVRGRQIGAEDLAVLSRFRARRLQQQLRKGEREARNAEWLISASRDFRAA